MTVEFITDLYIGPERQQCLVKKGDDYFVVSSIAAAPDHGKPETLVFPANAAGKVTSWGEVAGGINATREDAIAQLEAGTPSTFTDQYVEESGGEFAAIFNAFSVIAEAAVKG